jgi:hypothetical protein
MAFALRSLYDDGCTMSTRRELDGRGTMETARVDMRCDSSSSPSFSSRVVSCCWHKREPCAGRPVTWEIHGHENICEGPMGKHGIPGRALGLLEEALVWAGVSDGGFPAHTARGQTRFGCIDTPHMSELVDSTALPQGWCCFWKLGAVAAAEWRRHLRGKCGCIPIGWQQINGRAAASCRVVRQIHLKDPLGAFRLLQ